MFKYASKEERQKHHNGLKRQNRLKDNEEKYKKELEKMKRLQEEFLKSLE